MRLLRCVSNCPPVSIAGRTGDVLEMKTVPKPSTGAFFVLPLRQPWGGAGPAVNTLAVPTHERGLVSRLPTTH